MPIHVPPAVFHRALPFAWFIGVLALRGFLDAPGPGAGMVDPRWLYGAQIGVPAALLFRWRRDFVELLKFPAPSLWYPASVLVGLAVFAIWIAPMPPWMHLNEGGAGFVPLDRQGNVQWDLIALRCTGAVLLVPIMEEIFWRSFLMRWIDRRDFLAFLPAHGSAMALLASAFVFGLAHDLWVAGFLAGIAFGALYRRSGTLWFAVIAHATANLALALWIIAAKDWIYW